MSDIFGYQRNPKAKGVFSSENTLFSMGDLDGNAISGGMWLVQDWNVSYQQQVSEIFEIGSNNLYWVKGRPQGTGKIGRIIGGRSASATGGTSMFPREAYDICAGGAYIKLEVVGGHCNSSVAGAPAIMNKGVSLKMDGCVVTGIGFSMNVQQLQIVESYDWRFAYLDISSI